MEHRGLLIFGAGLSGMSTALHRDGDYLILERESRVGGLTRTEEIDGFLFDYTGHWLHLRDERVRRLVDVLLPGQTVTIQRRATIYSNGVFTDYPFQANLHGLPDPVLRECLHGAIEAAIRRAGSDTGTAPRDFVEYVTRHFGEGIARHFIVPYNTKLWGVSPTEVTAEWTQRFVPIPDVHRIVDGALGPTGESMGYNASFLYPTEGGIESLARAMVRRLDPERVLLNTRPRVLNLSEKWVEFGEDRVGFDALVSTVALPDLVAITADAPPAIREAAGRLRCSPLRYMNVGLSVDRPLRGAHWIYIPEPEFPFYRVGSASNALPGLAPWGASSLYVELSNDRTVSERDAMVALAAFLKRIGSIQRESQILFAVFRSHPWGYVIFDRHCQESRKTLLDFYRANGVWSIGRYGAWTYNSMEDAILDGIQASEALGAAG